MAGSSTMQRLPQQPQPQPQHGYHIQATSRWWTSYFTNVCRSSDGSAAYDERGVIVQRVWADKWCSTLEREHAQVGSMLHPPLPRPAVHPVHQRRRPQQPPHPLSVVSRFLTCTLETSWICHRLLLVRQLVPLCRRGEEKVEGDDGPTSRACPVVFTVAQYAPATTRPLEKGTPPVGSQDWLSAEEEKKKLYEKAKADAERAQRRAANMSSGGSTKPSPKGSQVS
jgi:hypothetical protein